MTRKTAQSPDLRRPRILIEAARIGAKNYRRESALNRIFKAKRPQPQQSLIKALRERESEIETIRKQADGTYSGLKHIQVMTALMAELRRGKARARP